MLHPTIANEFAKRIQSGPDLNLLPEPQKAAYQARLKWLTISNKHQIPPEGDWWTTWLLLAGRGAGKTRSAAEWVWWEAWIAPNTRWLISAPTYADVRDVCFEGESGLMAVIPAEIIENYSKTLQEIRLINGSTLKGIPASEPSRFRGPQFHGGWCDELAAWDYLDEAWDILQLGMRLGSRPLLACTTTPRPKPLISDLVARNKQDVAYVSASTYANIDNLAPTFRKQILQYEGTAFGRQEIYAEIIDPEESGIVKRAWFQMWDADKEIPPFEYIIQSYDCATSDKTQNDPTACTVWGVFRPGKETPMSIMLIDCWSEHIQYPELRSRVIKDGSARYGSENEFGSSKKVDTILVEDKSAGISLIQDLRRAGLPVRAYNPGNADKLQRLNIVAPIIQKGLVYIPESAKKRGTFRQWAEVFMSEVCAFPSGRHDDIVDSTSQALRLLRDLGFVTLDNIQPLFEDTYRSREPRQNPYAA